MAGGRTAVVTGASRGIGRAIAKKLVEDGWTVVATNRDPARGRPTAEKLGMPYHALDVTDRGSISGFVRWLDGDVDVLVNNAGVALDGFDARIARLTVRVNFFGAMDVTDALLPRMREGGRIVMVSSGVGELDGLDPKLRERFEDPELDREGLVSLMRAFVDDVRAGVHTERGWPSSAYRVSKIGLNALTRVLARELADDPRGISVNAACPGWVRTDMGGEAAPLSPEEGADTPVWLATADGLPTGGFFRDREPVPW